MAEDDRPASGASGVVVGLVVLVGLLFVGGALFTRMALQRMPYDAVAEHEAAAMRTLRAIQSSNGTHPSADAEGKFRSTGYLFEIVREKDSTKWRAYAWPDGGPTLPVGRTFYVDPGGQVLTDPHLPRGTPGRR